MMLKKLTTNMMVEDVNRTVDFYNDILGFEFVMAVPENSQEVVTTRQKDQVLDFAMMKCGNVEMMFEDISGNNSLFKGMHIGGSLTFYIEVDNIKELYGTLKEKVEVVKELHITFYGMEEFYIKDCNGYILAFAEKQE